MSLPAGSLNRRVAIERPSTLVDDLNQPLPGWEVVMHRWARPVGSTGMSAVRAMQEGVALAPGAYSWRIRYQPSGIAVAMRLNYKGMLFDIRELRHDFERQEFTDLVCSFGANDG